MEAALRDQGIEISATALHNINKESSRKGDILERLRRRLKMKRSRSPDPEPSTSKQTVPNNSRSVSFHWSNYEKQKYSTVGKQDYGGARDSVSVIKDMGKGQLILKAQSFYFDDGLSTKGEKEDFVFDMSLDARGKKLMAEDETVEDVIQKRKIKNPRFYLLSKRKIDSDSDSELPAANLGENSKTGNPSESSTGNESPPDKIIEKTSEEITERESDEVITVSETSNEIPGDIIDFALQTFDADDVRNGSPKNLHLKLHRGQVFTELIDYIMKSDIIKEIATQNLSLVVEMVLPNGKSEVAEDSGGVFRDMLTEFWTTFKEKCTEGSTSRVPFIRHNLTKFHWVAIAWVLVIGYRQEKYFPTFLACAFLTTAVDGVDPTEEDLMESFKLYIEHSEQDILQTALNNFDAADKEELFEFLEQYGCRVNPTRENIKDVILKIAHKQLVQAPAFISQIWTPILQTNLKPLLPTSLKTMIEMMKPTTSKVLKMVIYPPEAETQYKQVVGYLNRYIRGLETDMLRRFLRFCTGEILIIIISCTYSATNIQ